MTGIDDMTVLLAGEQVYVRGVEMERAETHSGRAFTDLFLHVQQHDEVDTMRVNISEVKKEGGLSAIMEGLAERSMIPEWYAAGAAVPEGYDG